MVEVETHKFCLGCPYLEIETTGEFAHLGETGGKPRFTCMNYNLCKRLMEWLEGEQLQICSTCKHFSVYDVERMEGTCSVSGKLRYTENSCKEWQKG